MSAYLEGLRTGASLGQNIVSSAFEGYYRERSYLDNLKKEKEAKEEKTYTPEQVEAIRQGLPSVVKRTLPGGVSDDKPLGDIFSKGVPRDSVAQQQKITEAETLAGAKADTEMKKTHTRLSGDFLERMDPANRSKLTGLGFGSGDWVPNTVIQNLSKPPAKTSAGDLSPEEQGALDQAARRKNNPLPLSMVASRGPRAKIMAQALLKDPNWSPSQGEAELAGAKAGSTERARQTQTVGAQASSIEGTLDLIKPMIDKGSDATFRTATEAFRKGLNQVDDPQANELLGYMASLRGFYATMLKNGGTPDQSAEEEAKKVISDGIGKKGFAGLDRYLRNEAKVRMKGITKGYQGDVASRYKDPAAAEAVRADYKAGRITKEEANKRLDALTGGQP